jgi:hypothetical protein
MGNPCEGKVMTGGNALNSFMDRGSMKSGRAVLVVGAAICFAFALGVSAQQAGPLKPPPGTTVTPPANSTNGTGGAGSIKPAPSVKSTAVPQELPPPTMPIDEIVKKFGEREAAFKEARDNYTYTQTVTVKDFGPAGEEGGEYHMVSNITFTPEGKRYEDVKFAPASTLQYIMLSPEDMQDLRNIQPFVLTTDELPKYDIKYVTHEPIDQLNAYVFEVSPKKIEKGKRYFEGRIWVDDKDLEIVKSFGKAVPDTKENVAPHFETIRENIAGNFWFPTYTHADDVLHFNLGGGGKHGGGLTQDTRIIMTVRYENYKYFGVKVKVGQAKPDKPDHEELEEPPQF